MENLFFEVSGDKNGILKCHFAKLPEGYDINNDVIIEAANILAGKLLTDISNLENLDLRLSAPQIKEDKTNFQFESFPFHQELFDLLIQGELKLSLKDNGVVHE